MNHKIRLSNLKTVANWVALFAIACFVASLIPSNTKDGSVFIIASALCVTLGFILAHTLYNLKSNIALHGRAHPTGFGYGMSAAIRSLLAQLENSETDFINREIDYNEFVGRQDSSFESFLKFYTDSRWNDVAKLKAAGAKDDARLLAGKIKKEHGFDSAYHGHAT